MQPLAGKLGNNNTHRERIRVVVADDDPRILDQVAAFLGRYYAVVGRVPDGEALLKIVGELGPQIAVVDLSMPKLGGLQATRVMSGRDPDTKVVILSIHDEQAYVEAAFEAGARGYVLKTAATSDLIPAIDRIVAGERYLSPQLESDAF